MGHSIEKRDKFFVEKPIQYQLKLTVNGHRVTTVLIGRHYTVKHGKYINDGIILRLVKTLDGGKYPVDSNTNGTDYFAADVLLEETGKIYRLVWLFEGRYLEILGVVNTYRRKVRRKEPNEK